MTRMPESSTDLVTYRYNGELIYAPLSPDYIQALSYAREAFPQLRQLSDTSLSLSTMAPGGTQQSIGISASAWPRLVAHMSRHDIIDVRVTQERYAQMKDESKANREQLLAARAQEEAEAAAREAEKERLRAEAEQRAAEDIKAARKRQEEERLLERAREVRWKAQREQDAEEWAQRRARERTLLHSSADDCWRSPAPSSRSAGPPKIGTGTWRQRMVDKEKIEREKQQEAGSSSPTVADALFSESEMDADW